MQKKLAALGLWTSTTVGLPTTMGIFGFGPGFMMYAVLMVGISWLCMVLPLLISMAYGQYCGQLNLSHRVTSLTQPWGHSGSGLYSCWLGQISPPISRAYYMFIEQYHRYLMLFLVMDVLLFVMLAVILFRYPDSIETAVNIYNIHMPTPMAVSRL